MTASLRRVLVAVTLVLTFVLLAGATYQGVATALERRQFPHPGRLVDVGGHQLHIICAGRGAPTVVFEAPAAGMSSAWAPVQSAVAAETRACSYDRAGLGWSESGDEPYDPQAVPRQLQTLLDNAGELEPYVLVGQGLGAAFAMLESAHLGSDTAALVLIDPPFAAGTRGTQPPTLALIAAAPWLARAGILRATRALSAAADGLPETAAGSLRAFLNRPDHLTRSADELRQWDETLQAAVGVSVPDTTPVVRLDIGSSGRVTFITAERDGLRVSHSILDVVDRVRLAPPRL